MSFLAPLLSLVGAGLGIGESAQNSSVAQQAAQEQNAIAAAQQTLNQMSQEQKMEVMRQLFPFFAQYLGQGSPFLSRIQSQAAGQNAQQFGNAAGQLRSQMQTTGLGYGPSGTTAAALGQLGTQAAQTSSSDYLNNLLANEQVKFQAAQGTQGLGSMFNFGGQNMPTTQPVQTTTGSSVFAAGQALQNLLKQLGGSTGLTGPVANTQLPTTLPGGTPPTFTPMPNPSGTQGYQLG